MAGIGLLARREYASGELSEVLSRKGYAPAAVAEAVDQLQADGYLNDERYAASLLRLLVSRGQGPQRIRQEMTQVGLGNTVIEVAMAAAPDWRVLAAQVRVRKFSAQLPTEWPERARQMRFLQYRGFSKDHIGYAFKDTLQEAEL
jgi:regulatory protein